MATDHTLRRSLSTTVSGVVVAVACWLALYLVLPPMVPSSDAGAPRGELQPKFEALSFLLWGVPVIAFLMVGTVLGALALGPEFLDVHNRKAREYWRSTEHWPEARAHVAGAVSIFTAMLGVWLVLILGVESGAPSRHLGQWRFAAYVGTGVAALVGLLWRVLQLERVPSRAGRES